MEELQAAKSFGNDSTESVGVDVEDSKICKSAELSWKVASNISVIEINASNNPDGGIGRRRCTENTRVGANISAIPVGGEVEWVRKNSVFPSLQSNIGLA